LVFLPIEHYGKEKAKYSLTISSDVQNREKRKEREKELYIPTQESVALINDKISTG
jgi:hypothetical protein